MTVLVIAAQKIVPFRLSAYADTIHSRFLEINQRGRISGVLAAMAVIALIAYVAALVIIFNAGLAMQGSSAAMARIQQDILKSEILLQAGDANFTADHKDILDTMEKISSITYIPHPSTAALAPRDNLWEQ